jgi:chemotaxis signal transduction protein
MTQPETNTEAARDARAGASPARAGWNGDADGSDTRELRELLVFRAGRLRFALFREEVEGAAENLRPAPLPFAPPAVLGVVALRGRVRTALDPLQLFAPPVDSGGEISPASARRLPPRLFVALAGDEQLALACDAAEESFTVSADELELAPDSEAPARGRVARGGSEVILLDPPRLFDASTRGLDRRRRRTT